MPYNEIRVKNFVKCALSSIIEFGLKGVKRWVNFMLCLQQVNERWGKEMGMKSKSGILILACVVVISAIFWYTQKEPYSTEAVMDSLGGKYSVQSTMIGGTDPVLDVSVYDEKDINEVERYLENNLSEEDSENYKLNVYQYSSNPKEFRDNAQENLIHLMNN